MQIKYALTGLVRSHASLPWREAVIVSLYDRLRINEKHRIGTIPLCTVRCTVGKYTHGPTRKKEMTNQNHSAVVSQQ